MAEDGVVQAHRERFGVEGTVYAAPGRVNLIGEHTDYTGGLVLPMAIGFQTRAVVSAREDGQAVFYSVNYGEEAAYTVASLAKAPRGHWSDYPAGVLWCLQQAGVTVGGFSMTLEGDVPLGAGLSSSASVEVVTAVALLGLAGATLPLKELAVLCRRAENEYVGAKSGIMDQFVVSGGVAERALLLDCRALTYELLPLPASVKVVICNSMVKHTVAEGEYGNRSDEVYAGQAVVARARPGVELLRDATVADLDACREAMGEASFLRCRHIVTENGRVVEARTALLAGDMTRFGELMALAHVSFRDDFAASCAEVDTLVEIAARQPGCFGARITGGGFGGCTVNVVKAEAAEGFVAAVRREYEAVTGIVADCFVCEASDGALALLEKGGGAMNVLAQGNPHRRWNPLKREWVPVSPNRTQRPWQGQTETTAVPAGLQYDPECYLCPGNMRAGGARTDAYTSTYVFENDYAALKLDAPKFHDDADGKGLLVAEGESGVCRVICFSPRHDLTLAKMSVAEIRAVVDVWAAQYAELGGRDDIAYVQVFENRGAMMGASNPHPHGQIWASRSLPNEVVAEVAGQKAHLAEKGENLLVAYATMELALKERVVAENGSFVAVVPFWAVWPFETMVLPKRRVARLEELTEVERDDFAAMLREVTSTYDQVFATPFPYSMGLHPAPSDGEEHAEWQFHAHFYPPLLRSATIRKFMVGFELLGGPQRDITPESAAETLRVAAERR